MRKIKVITMIALDGVMQAPGGPEEDTSGDFKYGGWTAPYGDELGGKEVRAQLQEPADFLLGRNTFKIWEGYWPQHGDFWPGINKGTKYVLSNTVKSTLWENTVFIQNLDDIKKVKESAGADIQVWGSSKLAQMLFANDLVDELCLKIYPVTLGKGKKLFDCSAIPASFTLTDSLVTTKGVVILNYKQSGEVETGEVEAK